MNSASGALAPSRVWAVRILSRRLVLEDMASRSLEPALACSIVCSSMDSSREVYLFRLQKICMRQIFVECKPVQADRKDRLVNGIYILLLWNLESKIDRSVTFLRRGLGCQRSNLDFLIYTVLRSENNT